MAQKKGEKNKLDFKKKKKRKKERGVCLLVYVFKNCNFVIRNLIANITHEHFIETLNLYFNDLVCENELRNETFVTLLYVRSYVGCKAMNCVELLLQNFGKICIYCTCNSNNSNNNSNSNNINTKNIYESMPHLEFHSIKFISFVYFCCLLFDNVVYISMKCTLKLRLNE